MRHVRKILRRPGADWRLLAQALMVHGMVVLMLRLVRFGRLQRWGSACIRTRARRGSPARDEDRILWAVSTAAAALPLGRTCLSEALTAHWLLAAAGRSSTIRFGIAAGEPRSRFAAHAWIESEGRPLLGLSNPADYYALE